MVEYFCSVLGCGAKIDTVNDIFLKGHGIVVSCENKSDCGALYCKSSLDDHKVVPIIEDGMRLCFIKGAKKLRTSTGELISPAEEK